MEHIGCIGSVCPVLGLSSTFILVPLFGTVMHARTCGIVLASFLYLLVSAVNRRDLEDRRWRGIYQNISWVCLEGQST
jgi:hypothetical protein